MSRVKNEILRLQAHIKTLRVACLALLVIVAGLWIGWFRSPSDLTIHVPPDLRSGSVRKWWDIPPANIYAFGLYIFQQINRWPSDGEQNYADNIVRYSNYLTPACQVFLEGDMTNRRETGQLRKRIRGVYEIQGRGYSDDAAFRVQTLGQDAWVVNLDMAADEYYGGERVKRAFVRFPVRVLRQDVDPEKNPFGLLLDCYQGAPLRITPPSTEEKDTGDLW
ncbi:PFL_4703 family integrating conjugative element protein [Azotobacter salinestris]|uniref:PFL_4703 family integrating conjugative element protein n=1 Tax=Azotobacter salinestris TaxID=69964 RepID=UPI0032DEFCA5